MNKGGLREMDAGDGKLLYARGELSTGIGPFYTEPHAVTPPSGVVRCDCLACREQQQHRTLFQREPT